MKLTKLILASGLIASLVFTSCTNLLDKPLNKEDFENVKELVNNDETLKEMKKKYIVDNLSTYLGFAELGKALAGEGAEVKTYGEYIEELKVDFDSTETQILTNIENNKKLKEFITLTDAKAIPIDKYKGYLTMNLRFNNEFEMPILYTVINYKYVNKYDSKFFEEKVKLTDEVAKDFKEDVEVTTTEKYNDVAKFLYSKVPVGAPAKLRKELGKEVADKKVHRDFLMEGLKIETLGIVFEDKSELTLQNEDWEYLTK
jgi:glutaredoxin-related protein